MASWFRASPSLSILGSVALLLAAAGCSDGGGAVTGTGGQGSGGTTGNGGSTAGGGAPGTGGTTTGTGGATGAGGTTKTAGTTGTGGATGSGGATGAGGTTKTAGTTGTGVPGSGGAVSLGGTVGTGGSGKGGATGSGGAAPRDGGPRADANPGTGGTVINIDGGPNCNATMPTSGGKTYTGTNGGGTIDGYNYGIWTNGKGGTITAFPGGAFTTNWSESQDFLAHLGIDYRGGKNWTDLGTIVAEFAEKKSGSAGGFSMIGMYGWTNSPCVEWYINEDAWNGMGGGGGTTVTIDGGTYSISSSQTTGTGGANACESGHSGSWTQTRSSRKGARTCGIVTISDHFAAWEKQGWKLGAVTSIHINVEVGGGTGSIDFPVANITVTGK
jgi:endo-1,4-beta-xylanase